MIPTPGLLLHAGVRLVPLEIHIQGFEVSCLEAHVHHDPEPSSHRVPTSGLLSRAGVRPVPLEIHIQGFEISSLEARMAAMLRPTYTAILNHAREGQPAIVFVPSRWHALRAALELLTFAAADGQPKRFLQVIILSSPIVSKTLCAVNHARQGQPAVVFVPLRCLCR